MQDSFGRNINYMRISLTDRCNYACYYCKPDISKHLCHSDILTYEQLLLPSNLYDKTDYLRSNTCMDYLLVFLLFLLFTDDLESRRKSAGRTRLPPWQSLRSRTERTARYGCGCAARRRCTKTHRLLFGRPEAPALHPHG